MKWIPNNKSDEEVFKAVCKKNKLKYIPPEQRVTLEYIDIYDENTRRYRRFKRKDGIIYEVPKIENSKLICSPKIHPIVNTNSMSLLKMKSLVSPVKIVAKKDKRNSIAAKISHTLFK